MAYGLSDYDKREYPLQLYEFRYRNPRTVKWHKARYRAELHEIRERHAEFEIRGEPTVITQPSESYNRWRTPHDGR